MQRPAPSGGRPIRRLARVAGTDPIADQRVLAAEFLRFEHGGAEFLFEGFGHLKGVHVVKRERWKKREREMTNE